MVNKYLCPKCNSECKPRWIKKDDLVYDCSGCSDQIAPEAIKEVSAD